MLAAAGDPIMFSAAGDPIMQKIARSAGGDPIMYSAAGDPIMTNAAGDPIMQAAAGDPIMTNAAGDPIMSTAAGDPIMLGTSSSVMIAKTDHFSGFLLNSNSLPVSVETLVSRWCEIRRARKRPLRAHKQAGRLPAQPQSDRKHLLHFGILQPDDDEEKQRRNRCGEKRA